jgi:diaminohydroxyphosphoribosylaminopyrimidine deaminase/5-amino-6-(5-phosphoribosylamino)uracil reductase
MIMEGGARTLQSFIDENLWDEARIFIGNTNFFTGIKSPRITGQLASKLILEKDVLKIITND